MTSPLPQLQTLTGEGVFLRLTQDGNSVLQGLTRNGVTLATPVPRIKAEIHLTNVGRKPVELTLRSMKDGVKVGSSQINTVVPQQSVTVSFDDWFTDIEFLAAGVAGNDGVTSLMVRGAASVAFSVFLHPTDPKVGTINDETPPFDYPSHPPV